MEREREKKVKHRCEEELRYVIHKLLCLASAKILYALKSLILVGRLIHQIDPLCLHRCLVKIIYIGLLSSIAVYSMINMSVA